MKKFADQLIEELGVTVAYFDSVSSTSLYAKDLILKEQIPPDIIFARTQTSGQGRVGKSFYSPSDTGLYTTFHFPKSKFAVQHITPRLSLALCHAIEAVFPVSCSVKWVNDVNIGRKKVAGILTQSVSDSYLFGFGINVETPKTVPSDIRDRFGAVTKSCERECYYKLLKTLYEEVGNCAALSDEALFREYSRRCGHIGKKVSILADQTPQTGICTGIANDFSLLIATNGKTMRFSSGILTVLE